MLCDRLAVQNAGAGRIIPDVEMKFKKDDFDRYAMSKAKRVLFDDIRFFVLPIELQIPYKLYLGSDKDIEDAVYLWMLFREMLDGDLLRMFMERLQVRGEQYGIEV